MAHQYYVLKPVSGSARATSVDFTTSPKKNNIMHLNPAGDTSGITQNNSLVSGSVPAGG